MRPSRWNKDPESFMKRRSVGCSLAHIATHDPDEQKVWDKVSQTLKTKGAEAALAHLKQIRLEQTIDRC